RPLLWTALIIKIVYLTICYSDHRLHGLMLFDFSNPYCMLERSFISCSTKMFMNQNFVIYFRIIFFRVYFYFFVILFRLVVTPLLGK
ncbi:hypothetical protein L9F63_007062, partial [Diploptera punctata]